MTHVVCVVQKASCSGRCDSPINSRQLYIASERINVDRMSNLTTSQESVRSHRSIHGSTTRFSSACGQLEPRTRLTPHDVTYRFCRQVHLQTEMQPPYIALHRVKKRRAVLFRVVLYARQRRPPPSTHVVPDRVYHTARRSIF